MSEIKRNTEMFYSKTSASSLYDTETACRGSRILQSTTAARGDIELMEDIVMHGMKSFLLPNNMFQPQACLCQVNLSFFSWQMFYLIGIWMVVTQGQCN